MCIRDRTSNDVCAFCGKHHGTPNADGTLEGDLLFPPFRGNDNKPVWVHAQCALFSAEVHGEREGDLYNVLNAIKRGRSLKCAACGERGATVGCGEKRCSKSFHLRCAAAHGLLQGETTFHCRKHASWPDAVQCDRCFKWRAWNRVEIEFRAAYAIDPTLCSMAWRFHAIDATLSPWPRRLDGVEVHLTHC